MRVALHTTFAASKKEPLAAMFDRVLQAFLAAGMGEPAVRFTFSDAPLEGLVSSVNRVLKRHPEMQWFLATDAPMTGFPEVRRLSNAMSGKAAAYSTIHAIAAGVPRSFPFHNAAIHFHAAAFGDLVVGASKIGAAIPGIMLTDNWWVNGRNRSLSALAVVDADVGSKTLPSPPEAVAAVLAACGKVKRTLQVPLPPAEPQPQPSTTSASPEAANTVRAIVADYRGRLKEIVERAALPHDLPPAMEVLLESLGVTSGPMKPFLERTFKPMGYTCRCESGTFTLRRRTQENLTAQLYLDVGTWSHQVTAMFQVLGIGFKATLTIPVAIHAMEGMQYPIGNAERWQKIVENLAALVAELDRTLVPDVERAAGPTPEWYKPES
jgi:hypothetical protein